MVSNTCPLLLHWKPKWLQFTEGGGVLHGIRVINLVLLFDYMVNFYYRKKRLWYVLMYFFNELYNMYSHVLKSTALCAHHSPCFPGNCSDTISCQCSDGFTGDTGRNRCKTCKLRFFFISVRSRYLCNFVWKDLKQRFMTFAKGQRNFVMMLRKSCHTY